MARIDKEAVGAAMAASDLLHIAVHGEHPPRGILPELAEAAQAILELYLAHQDTRDKFRVLKQEYRREALRAAHMQKSLEDAVRLRRET